MRCDDRNEVNQDEKTNVQAGDTNRRTFAKNRMTIRNNQKPTEYENNGDFSGAIR